MSGIAVGTMTSLHFMGSLPIARTITDSNQHSRDSISRKIHAGNYRVLNDASKKCLSFSTRSTPFAPASQSTTPRVSGWACGVPGVDDDLHQIWTVRPTPTKPPASSTVSTNPQIGPTSSSSSVPGAAPGGSTNIPTGIPPATSPVLPPKTSSLTPGGPPPGHKNVTTGPSLSSNSVSTAAGPANSALAAPPVAPKHSNPTNSGALNPPLAAGAVTVAPKPSIAQSTLPKRYKNSVVFESLDFASTAGVGHAFRLDFANIATPIVNPDIPSGRDQVPNGVNPPTNPVFNPITASTPSAPPTPAPVIPSISSYARPLDVLPQGADTSSFQILSTGSDDLFLIYCPSNGTFIGHTPSKSGMDGSPIQAVDLNKYLLDIEAFLVAQKGVGSDDILLKIKTELGFWVWSLVRADFGPARDAFRIVHDETKLALDSKAPKPGSFASSGVEGAGSAQGAGAPLHGLILHTNTIDPAASSQIWDTLPLANADTATIIHTINNHVDQSPIVPSSAASKNSWRMIYIPTAQPTVGNAPGPPSPSPTVPSQYLLFNTNQRSFLGLQSHNPDSRRGSSSHSPSTPSSRSAPSAFEAKSGQVQEFQFSFDDVPKSFHETSTWEISPREINPVLALLYQDVERFRNDFGWLIWRILPVEWAPTDGIYTIQSIPSTTYMDIPESIFASPCPLSLNAAYPFPSIGSEWWRFVSQVDPDSGTIYQTVTNYRSGHIIDNSASSLVGRRSGNTKDEKWRFVSPLEGGLSFAFMDYATLNNGVVVGATGKAAAFAVTDSKDLLWKLAKIDLGVSDGSYYIRDLKSRQYLTRNSQKKQQEPLLLTSNPTSWVVSTVSSASGVRLSRVSASGDSSCVLFAPTSESIFADLPSPGETFAITNYDNEIADTSEGAQFEIECDFTTGESSILSKSLQKYLSVSAFTDDEKTLAVSFISGKDAPKEWEFIPVTPANRDWALPSWLLKNKTGIPNLADGVYRITNGQTKNCLALGTQTTSEGTKGVEVTGNLKEAAVDQLWYFKRDRNPVVTPQLQTYTITSLERPLVLQERVENIGQPVEGLQLWAGPIDLFNASVTASQKWMIWKQSALTWCLQAVGGSGGLLDIGTGNLPCTTPLLTSTPKVLQTWQLNKALPEVSGGYYRIRNQFTQSFVSEHGLDVVASSYAFYGKTASDFRLAALPNGLCRLQSMSSLQYLSCSLVAETATPVFVQFTNPDDLSSCWLLLPTKDGLLIQNALTRTNLTTTHGSAEDGIVMELLPGASKHKKGPTPWQVFSFERVDSPSPAFDDLSSDKIAAGQYTVTNVNSGQQLGWGSSSSATSSLGLGTPVICKSPVVSNPNFWTIAPSGTGYYSFNLSALPLGLNHPTQSQPVPIAGVGISGLDSSMWKLLKFDTGNYRIINKSNGLLLLQDSTGKALLGPGDNKANQQNEWKLDLNPKPSTASPIPTKSADRELQPTNGLYLFSNSQSSNVFTISTPTTAPTVVPRDLEASSVDGRKQVWIVEMNRDNWFIIKSFPFGMSLAFNDSASSLVLGSNDGSSSFQWKFLQDTATGTMRIVPRNRPNLAIAPDINNALSLVSYSGLPLQRWTMIRSSGTSADTKLAQGVYTISLYQAPNPFGLQTQASTVNTAVQTDKQYNENLNNIANSASNVASGLTSTFPAPALPADVVLGTVLDTLETSDFNDAPAALSIASWFYATLNGVTKAAPPSAPAASTRVMAISDSLVKISQIVVSASTIGSTVTAAGAAKQINDITSTTSLLTDTSSQGLQSGILAAAQQFLTGLNIYIQTLPPPASLATDVDPSTPSTITQGDGDSPPVTRSPLAAQSLPQYWFISSAGADLFTISHLTSKKYLAYDKTTASSTQRGKIILQANTYNWRFTNQRLGGYAIISAVDSNIAICMPVASSDVNGETFVADGMTGAQRQRWSLLRSGYYLQNQEQQNWNKVVAKNATGNDVFLTPYRPFGANTLLNGIRSDALCIWHLVKVDTGKYCFYNEASRTALRNGGDNVVVVASDLKQEGGDTWQFAKNGNDMWFAPGNVNNRKWMSTNGADGQTIVVNDPGDKESWKGWQLISVTATERGILMNLPRCILSPRNTGSGNLDASLVVSIDPQNSTGPFVQRQYKPDDSYQRFRIYTYAKWSFYINEATASIVKAGGGTADLSGVADQSAWFTSDASQNISCLQGNVTPLFAKAISNTGDLGSSNLSVRIQIGKIPGDTSAAPRVLSVDLNGTPIAEPWDRLSAQQVWSYLDWDKGRYIIHAPTSEILALSGHNLVLLAPGSYTQEALWKNDYSRASTAGINGFFPIQPVTLSTSMTPTGITESNGGALTISALPQFGFRFITDSSWFFFTDRLALLNTFLTSHNPVFCHAKGAPLPISVDSYLASSTLNNRPVPTPLPTLPGDYVLTYSGAPSNGSSAVAYIVVRSATEPIYINYTDISYYLLYPPSSSPSTTGGWTYITMRFNNYSNLLSSVYFPSLGWIYNLNLSTDPSATNPLSIIKRADGTTKLHVQIGSDLQPVPGFGTMLNSDIITATNWGFVLDSSQSANNLLLEAGMVRDDEAGSRPVPPSWAGYKGAWIAGGGAGARFPAAV